MKINLNEEIKKLDGSGFVLNVEGDEKSNTIKSLLIRAALYEDQREVLNGEVKFERYALAKKLTNAIDSIDLPLKDVTTLKNNSSKLYSVEAYGSICNLIDPTE